MRRHYRRHADPEQAAQMYNNKPGASPTPRPHSGSNAGPGAANYNKPVPPPPQSQSQGGYGGRPPPPGAYGSSTPVPQQTYAQQQPSYNQQSQNSYNEYNRVNSPRYDSQQQHQRYGSGSSQAPPPPQNYSSQPPRPSLSSPTPPGSDNPPGPPQSYAHNRPPIPEQQRPPTVAPPKDHNDRDALWPLFLQVDKDRSGQLSEEELRRALVNGDYTAFDIHTVKMMIRMFDTDRSGTINFDEFCGLWGFLASWRGLFDRFDVDRSGNISHREFEDALVAFGYRLSPQFTTLLFNTYARSHSRGRGDEGVRERVLSFDLFVQACISLKRMTDVFKKFDTDRDGYITLSL